MSMVAVHMQDELRAVLDDEGRVLRGARVPAVPDEDLLKIFDTMLLVRAVDDRMMKLQRQGGLGFYMKALGEEASHFAVYCLRQTDWVFPSYREQGAWLWAGLTLDQFLNQLFGNEQDPTKGRQMPVHHSASWLNYVSISSPVGTQIPQAVGAAMAMKASGTDDVAVVYFGEGTTSTGEFHVGMNFAGVAKAPCVFICRNNGYAISVPTIKQCAAPTYAAKAIGYGMPGVRVDGNDVLAVIQVMNEAVERARAGDGPTMIEAVTYRREGHSSSDDPSVYRDAAEPEPWAVKDPLKRLRGYLKVRGVWSEDAERQTVERHVEAINAALERAQHLGDPAVESLFDDVFEELPWHRAEQNAGLMDQPRPRASHKH
jgi:2-oxoisovalerate dehydrogenase E1 component alpha subunit